MSGSGSRTKVEIPAWLASAAAQLLHSYETQQRREDDAYRRGYIEGHRAGWEVGYGHAHEEMAREWAAIWAPVKRLGAATATSHEELQRRRADPGGAAYVARLSRHGSEYEGGAVDWDSGRPVRRSA